MSKNDIYKITHLIIYALYLFFSFTIISNDGFKAQDFATHIGFVHKIISGINPLKISYETNPPLLFIIGATVIRTYGESLGLKVVASVFAILNCLSLHFLWLCSRLLLSYKISLIALLLIATLPSFVTTSVVFASDALVFFPFYLFCYLNVRLLESNHEPHISILLASSLSQILGGLIKYSFLGIAPAVFFLFGYLTYKKKYSLYTAIKILFIKYLSGCKKS
jgi:hypothetical protein